MNKPKIIKIKKVAEPDYKFLYEDTKKKLEYAMNCLIKEQLIRRKAIEHIQRCGYKFPPYYLNEEATEELLEILILKGEE